MARVVLRLAPMKRKEVFEIQKKNGPDEIANSASLHFLLILNQPIVDHTSGVI